ncbi:MAG: hypothetical protein ACUVQ5_05400 [Candidatus Methanomethylicaceae archaeon]
MRRSWSHRGKEKGISTLIGTAIFMLIFMLMISAIVLWTQSYIGYLDTVREEGGLIAEKVMEELSVSFLNSSGKLTLVARNPTPYATIITQIWSGHTVQTGEWAVPAKSLVYINTDLNYLGMTASKVVTSRGNIFSGMQAIPPGTNETGPSEDYITEAGRWYVQWYNLSARQVFDMKLGESYWQSLSITFQWGTATNDPIFGPYARVGFNATTRVVALGSKIYINYNVNEDIRVIIRELGIDSGWNTGVGYVEADASVGGVYTITILYSRWTGAPYLSLNVANADFTKLLTGG